jgi:hypothetical protein
MPQPKQDFKIVAVFQTPRTVAAALAERGIKLPVSAITRKTK